VSTAGWFTVLRPTGWFSAVSRLPGGFRYLIKGRAVPEWLEKPSGSGAPNAANSGSSVATPSVQILQTATRERGVAGFAVIALAAAAVTLGMLWWIIRGGR
jgi:hypothetical protein